MLEIKPVKPNTAELDDFLALPKKIYRPEHLMQSEEEELALIEGSHPLSSDLEIYAFIGYVDSRPCIRGLLTSIQVMRLLTWDFSSRSMTNRFHLLLSSI